MRARVTLIAAVSKDGFISRGKGVPWNLPEDRAHFRALTAGQWLLMGRTTYEEMRGWFTPSHHPLVLTRDEALPERVPSVQAAIARATGELFVCGGGQCYAAAMPHADRLVLTVVDEVLHAGVAFPAVDAAHWQRVDVREHEGFRIETWLTANVLNAGNDGRR